MRPIYAKQPERGFILEHALDEATCAHLVAETDAQGFASTARDYPPSYRDNDRLLRDDPALAAALFERLATSLPPRIVDASGAEHVLVGLNERFRFCRYRDGQSFRIHRDGAHARSDDERSHLTLQVYLDDEFDGGHTRFYDGRRGACVAAVRPVRGSAIVFEHDLWHDGEPVTRGTKHVLRTDVLYRRLTPAPSTTHRGYVYSSLVLADGRLVTASRDRTVRVAGRTVASGHTGSIHALLEPTPGSLLTGSRDHTVRALDLSDGSSRLVGEHDGAVLCFALVGQRVASGGADGAVVLRDLDGRAKASLRGHRGWVWSLAALGDDLLVSASEDGSLRLWSLRAMSALDASWVGRGPVHAVVALGQQRFAAGYADGHVLTFAVRHGTLECVDVVRAMQGEVYTLRALPGGVLAVGGEDDVVRVFDGSTCVAELPHGGFVRTLTELPDGSLVSGGYDQEVRIWPRPEPLTAQLRLR